MQTHYLSIYEQLIKGSDRRTHYCISLSFYVLCNRPRSPYWVHFATKRCHGFSFNSELFVGGTHLKHLVKAYLMITLCCIDRKKQQQLPAPCEKALFGHVDTEVPDQLAYLHRLIRACAVCLQNIYILYRYTANALIRLCRFTF